MRWFLFLLALVAGSAHSADVTVDWDPHPGATLYRTYTSPLGNVWTLGAESPTLPITTTIPDTGGTEVMGCTILGALELCNDKAVFKFYPERIGPKNLTTPEAEMATEVLISNNDLNTRPIGEVVSMFNAPHTWGGREGFPNYMHLTITDVDLDVGRKFLEEWVIDFTFNIQVDNPQRVRYNIEVDAESVSSAGVGQDQLKVGMQAWAEDNYNATVLAFTPDQFTVDVPKPFDQVQFVSDFNDIWRDVFETRRYILNAANIALGQVAGQVPDMTMAEANVGFDDKIA